MSVTVPRNSSLRRVAEVAGWAVLVFASLIAGEISGAESDKDGAEIKNDSGAVSYTDSYTLRIEESTFGPDPSVDTIAIMLSGSDALVAGFALKIGIDHPEIQIDEIIPGDIIDSCNWELFSPRNLSSRGTGNDPGQVWSIVGLAKSSGDNSKPLCYSFDREASLCKIVLSYEPLPGSAVSTVPMFFYWQTCRDNLLTDMSGSLLSISREVIDFSGDTLVNETDILPSLAGTPESCFKANALNHPRRIINFRNAVARIVITEPE